MSKIRAAAPVMVAALIAAPFLGTGVAAAQSDGDSAASYSADLQALNPLDDPQGSGSLTLTLDGDQATVNEQFSGLAATFMDAPFPHVQHIHGGATGECPTAEADANGDGVISVPEGAPAYGAIQTTLSTSGDTSPEAATNLEVAPSGASAEYSRTFTINQPTIDAINDGTAVVVVHGVDPSLLSQEAQDAPSNIVPELPLAATAPALCGSLTAAQMTSVPTGAAETGGGSTAGLENTELLALGGVAVIAAGGTALLARRRGTSTS